MATSRAPPVTLNGTTYNLAATGAITTGVKSANTIAPYLGLGYDSTHYSDLRWALALDLGVIYGGKPTSTITAVNELHGSRPAHRPRRRAEEA